MLTQLLELLGINASSTDIPSSGTLHIEDGNGLLYKMHKLPKTYRETSLRVLDYLKDKCDVIFSLDSYRPNSIKAQERIRRCSSEKIILKSSTQQRQVDFKEFLLNYENKRQFFQIMKTFMDNGQCQAQLTT